MLAGEHLVGGLLGVRRRALGDGGSRGIRVRRLARGLEVAREVIGLGRGRSTVALVGGDIRAGGRRRVGRHVCLRVRVGSLGRGRVAARGARQVGSIVGQNVGGVDELNGARDLGAELGRLGGLAALHEAGGGIGVKPQLAPGGGKGSRQRHVGETFEVGGEEVG